MLLSDGDIRKEIDAGRVQVEPYDAGMVQPSSIDVRLDRFFRVFENHRYPFIDPSAEQSELTRMVESVPDEPFILHPRGVRAGFHLRSDHAARRHRGPAGGEVVAGPGSDC